MPDPTPATKAYVDAQIEKAKANTWASVKKQITVIGFLVAIGVVGAAYAAVINGVAAAAKDLGLTALKSEAEEEVKETSALRASAEADAKSISSSRKAVGSAGALATHIESGTFSGHHTEKDWALDGRGAATAVRRTQVFERPFAEPPKIVLSLMYVHGDGFAAGHDGTPFGLQVTAQNVTSKSFDVVITKISANRTTLLAVTGSWLAHPTQQ